MPVVRMTLMDCGDVLTIPEVSAVLRISTTEYYRLKQHGAFPIQPLDSLGGAVRYSKTAVQRYLDGPSTQKLRMAKATLRVVR